MATIRLIKHEAVPGCGSFEVRFADGSPSRYFLLRGHPAVRMADLLNADHVPFPSDTIAAFEILDDLTARRIR